MDLRLVRATNWLMASVDEFISEQYDSKVSLDPSVTPEVDPVRDLVLDHPLKVETILRDYIRFLDHNDFIQAPPR